jgi:AraC-like DNA-binding protein
VTTPVPSLYFDSDAFPRPLGFERWRQAVSDYDVRPAPGHDVTDFHVTSTAWLLGDVIVTSGRLTPVCFTRTRERALADGHDRYSLLLLTSGSWTGDVDGATLTVGPGQVVVFDLTRPVDTIGTDNEHLTLGIARSAIAATGVMLPDLHGRILDGAGGRLAADHLLTLARLLPSASVGDVPSIARATTFLLANCFTMLPRENGTAPVNSHLGHRVRRYIDENLRLPDLSPDTICRDVGVSRSTLYREFAPLGGVARYIRTRRLEAAHSRLAHPAGPETIASVGYGLGFASDSHFSKAFRRRFGFAPGAARRRAERVVRAASEEGSGDVVAQYREWVKALTRR